MSFGNEAWGEDLKIFDSYTSLTHTIEAYLLPLLSFSSFDIFRQQKFGVEKYSHTQCYLGVSTTILNPVDIFCRWYKLNFGLLQDQVKSCHFAERIEAKRQYFYFLYIFLGITGWKRRWTTFWIQICIYYYLLNGTGLG